MADSTIIKVKRRWFNIKATIGELFIDNNPIHQCFTLEDVVRNQKIDGETAIPKGQYELVMAYSHRFGKIMPRLLSVPGFEGILIHPGNSDKNTEGCILVGRIIVNADFIGESRAAFGDLFPILKSSCDKGKVYVHITEEPVAPLPDRRRIGI